MKGLLFLAVTISLLLMLQIQTEVLGEETNTSSTTKPSKPSGAASALGTLGGGSLFLLLSSALVHLFYLS